jgi:hypothetical protein
MGFSCMGQIRVYEMVRNSEQGGQVPLVDMDGH